MQSNRSRRGIKDFIPQRPVYYVFTILLSIAGAFVGYFYPKTITLSYLVNFASLCSVGVFPSIGLLIGSMTAGGREPLLVQDLYDELDDAIKGLLIILAFGVLLVLSASLAVDDAKYLSAAKLSILFFAGASQIYFLALLPGQVRKILSKKYELASKEAFDELSKTSECFKENI